MAFDNFPYTNFHELNADWLLKTVKESADQATEAAETVETYGTRLSTVEGVADAALNLASDANSTATAARDSITLLLPRMTAAENNIVGLQTVTGRHTTEISGLDSRLTTAEGNITTLQAADTALGTRMTTAEGNITSLQAADTALGTRMTTAEGNITSLQTRMTAVETAVTPETQVSIGLNEQETGYECDKTLAQILAALDAGNALIADFTDAVNFQDNVIFMTREFSTDDSSVVRFYFHAETILIVASVTSSGVTVFNYRTGLPAVNMPGDAGKAITVNRFGVYQLEQLRPVEETVSGTTATIAAAGNTIYNCGELTSLTISSIPAAGDFMIVFDSGSTATTLGQLPAGMSFPETFTPSPNTHYEINVNNGYALAAGWPITP